jgi:esterase/lipase
MRKKWFFGIPLVLILSYSLGPNPSTPKYDNTIPYIPNQIDSLDNFVRSLESAHKLKPDNQARIIWAHEHTRQRTEYAIIYLHGFSASQAEGEPVHRDIARKFGCNLYLARLAEHGLDTIDALANFTADKYWESAKQAFAIGKQLGDKVIVMGCSTGGTAALLLAAHYPELHSLILLSPNIKLFDSQSWLLNNPWGLHIARKVLQSDYFISNDTRDIYKQYWYPKYRIEGLVQLEELVESSMNRSTFEKIRQPTLTLYYYKDRVHQDSVVSVKAMKSMMEELGTDKPLKQFTSLPQTGNHVIGSYIKSKDIGNVENEIQKFMIGVLQMKGQ